MKNKVLILFGVALFTSCVGEQTHVTQPQSSRKVLLTEARPTEIPEAPKKSKKASTKSVEDRLKSYFNGFEIKAEAISDNRFSGRREERQEKISLSNHTVVWFHSFEETKIKINDDLISLQGKKTLNEVQRESKEDVDFVNNWNQIKHFKFGGRELIGISMYNDPCTGIGCRVQMFLIYDLKTKTANFFGTYRFLLDREFGLFDFRKDGRLDFLSGTYDGESEGLGNEFRNRYEVFTMNREGVFQLQLNKEGTPYFMQRTYSEENYKEIDSKFKYDWMEEID